LTEVKHSLIESINSLLLRRIKEFKIVSYSVTETDVGGSIGIAVDGLGCGVAVIIGESTAETG
jgi:hypothetical protein